MNGDEDRGRLRTIAGRSFGADRQFLNALADRPIGSEPRLREAAQDAARALEDRLDELTPAERGVLAGVYGRLRAALADHQPPVEDEPIHLPTLMGQEFGISTSEGRRLLYQGGVSIEYPDGKGRPLDASDLDMRRGELQGATIQCGKIRSLRIDLDRSNLTGDDQTGGGKENSQVPKDGSKKASGEGADQ